MTVQNHGNTIIVNGMIEYMKDNLKMNGEYIHTFGIKAQDDIIPSLNFKE